MSRTGRSPSSPEPVNRDRPRRSIKGRHKIVHVSNQHGHLSETKLLLQRQEQEATPPRKAERGRQTRQTVSGNIWCVSNNNARKNLLGCDVFPVKYGLFNRLGAQSQRCIDRRQQFADDGLRLQPACSGRLQSVRRRGHTRLTKPSAYQFLDWPAHVRIAIWSGIRGG